MEKMSLQNVSSQERNHLRELAKKQWDYSQLPIMQQRVANWYRHNDLKGEVPMIHFETWTCEDALLPAFKCTSEAGKTIELQLMRNILNHEMVGDDRVVPACFTVGWHIHFVLFDLQIEREYSKGLDGRELGHLFKHPITQLPEDLEKLKPSRFTVDRAATMAWKELVEDVLGDILPVKMGMGGLGASLSQHIVHMMGMENMMFAMVDQPDAFHDIMERMTADYTAYMRWMETEQLLFLNNGSNGVAQGTFGYTHDLPGKDLLPGEAPRTQDLWGYMDSQETVSISPAMFGEFFFPYYLKTAQNYGLLSYGCCEPVHAVWENYISKLPNLRKVSISPWCDEAYMGQVLKGTRTIYHRKPSPNFVGVGKELDEEAFRSHILKTLQCAKGCKLEFSFRDVYELGGNPQKPRRAVQILREMLADHW